MHFAQIMRRRPATILRRFLTGTEEVPAYGLLRAGRHATPFEQNAEFSLPGTAGVGGGHPACCAQAHNL
eukprot:2320387-Pyramimonas_sp.AAC.1